MIPDTVKKERRLILDRFLSDEQLAKAGRRSGLSWFEENEVGFKNREKAQEILADSLDTKELQEVLTEFGLEQPVFPWFLGEHYTVEFSGGEPVVREECREDLRTEINKDLKSEVEKDWLLGMDLNEAVRKGYQDISEIRAIVYFGDSVGAELNVSDEKRAEVLDGIRGIVVSQRTENGGYRFRIASELAVPILRGSKSVLPAEEIVVKSEIFGRKRSAEEILMSELSEPRTVEEGDLFDVFRRGDKRGYVQVTDTTPDGKVEIVDSTELKINYKRDRASVMEDEIDEENRIEMGMADLVLKALEEHDGKSSRESILESVEGDLTRDIDVYHLITDIRDEELRELIEIGIDRLLRKGEIHVQNSEIHLTEER